MIEIKGSVYRMVADSKIFFKTTQYYHIALGLVLFATGIAAQLLSSGSDGTSKVPYFFTAFISGAWHVMFIVFCQLCMYYLSGDGSRSSSAGQWIHVYSSSCAMFVLFNVTGVVFTVVNGICIENQMCYYDKYHASNRMMAVLLILEHCACILGSILIAKRVNMIYSELNAETAIKLNRLDLLRIRTKHLSVASLPQSAGSSHSEQTNPSHSGSQKEHGLSHVQNKGGHILTTIEISAMNPRKTHRRSRSQPIMLKQLGLKPPEMEGETVSIFSDSDMKVNVKNRKKKRRFIPAKANRVKTTIEISTEGKSRSKSTGHEPEFNASDDDSISNEITPRITTKQRKQQLSKLTKVRKTNKPFSEHDDKEADDFFSDGECLDIQNLLDRQSILQKEQERLYAKQTKLFQVQQRQQVMESTSPPQPPPYESWASPSPTIVQVESADDTSSSVIL